MSDHGGCPSIWSKRLYGTAIGFEHCGSMTGPDDQAIALALTVTVESPNTRASDSGERVPRRDAHGVPGLAIRHELQAIRLTRDATCPAPPPRSNGVLLDAIPRAAYAQRGIRGGAGVVEQLQRARERRRIGGGLELVLGREDAAGIDRDRREHHEGDDEDARHDDDRPATIRGIALRPLRFGASMILLSRRR